MINSALFLALRRIRVPLVALIAAYSVSIAGLVLIPGIEIDGLPQRLDFFHAFYVISYTATTIGFGEIPHAFSDAQRMWVTISAYLCVFSWLYSIGAVLALFRDPAFRQVIGNDRFERGVRRINERFYIVCGYGDTGSLVVRAMTQLRMHAVVLDSDQERINELSLENLPIFVPSLCANASQPHNLLKAGLTHPFCAGVVALTSHDQVNLKIAITCKLLNKKLKSICRAGSHDAEANMESFGTDAVINPFDTFADRLALALHSPDMYLIYEWLTETPGMPLPLRINPPRGTWILCGYGRFGKAVRRYLESEGVKTVVVESNLELTNAPADAVLGRGTEAVTLREAHIETAVGIVAGTDDDANNLSIILTARELNQNLFLVARQTDSNNAAIFKAAGLDLIMQRSRVIAHRILTLVRIPLLMNFLRLVRRQNNEWAERLLEKLWPLVGNATPDLWVIEISETGASAVVEALREGYKIRLAHLLADPRDRDERLACLPLLLLRAGEEHLLPEDRLPLALGDLVLICGRLGAAGRMGWTLSNRNVLRYTERGVTESEGYVWRWLSGRGRRESARRPSGVG